MRVQKRTPGRTGILPFFDRLLSPIEAWLAIIGAALIGFMMVWTATEIVLRYVFNRSITGQVEIVELTMVGVVFLGIAYAQRVGAHVRMEFFLARIKSRVRTIVECIELSLALFIFIIVAVYSLKDSVLPAIALGDATPILSFPTWPAKLCVCVGSFMLCLRFVVQIIHRVSRAAGGVQEPGR